MEEAYPGNQLPIPRTTIPVLVNEFNQAIGEFKDGLALMRSAQSRLNAAFLPRYSEFNFLSDKYVSKLSFDNGVEAVIKEVTRHVWKTLIERMGIRSVMSIQEAKDMDGQVEAGQMPPITEKNILATMEGIFNRIPDMMEKAVKEVYDWLRPSSHRDDGYKTNEKNIWELGEKVILTWMVEKAYSGGSFRVNYQRQQNLTALDNVFSMLDGKGTIKTTYGPLLDAIEKSERGVGETEYFAFKCFFNNNLHLKFRRMDLVARLNAVAGGARIKDVTVPKQPKAQPPRESMTKVKTVAVPDEVWAILKEVKFEGNVVLLPYSLERSLYAKVDQVLRAAGGKWNRAQKGHVFDSDPRAALGLAVAEGKMMDEKKTYQFYATPAELAARMAGMLLPLMGKSILEPSAGDGALIRALFDKGVPEHLITAVELEEKRAFYLRDLLPSATVIGGDFLTVDLPHFDRIIANPPFTGGQDITHVSRMLQLLHPGGLLVCVTSCAWISRENQAARDLREQLLGIPDPFSLHSINAGGSGVFINDHYEVKLEVLPPGTFKDSGTEVSALLLKAQKEHE